MAQVSDLLSQKGSHVYAVSPTATVLAATKMMNHHKIGALVVTLEDQHVGAHEGCDRVVGMFTERDVLRRIVVPQRDPASTLIEEIMTSEVIFCRPETYLEEVGAVMRERRIRHMPVCNDRGELAGLVSIGDLNAWHARGQEAAIHYLHDYIFGRV